MPNFGDLVLVLGDHHIPSRSSDLPACFKDLLQTDKITTVLCTGNAGSKKSHEQVQALAKDVHIVRGEADPGVGMDICGMNNAVLPGSNGMVMNPNMAQNSHINQVNNMMNNQNQYANMQNPNMAMQQPGTSGMVNTNPQQQPGTVTADIMSQLPDSLVVEIGKFKVGLINGYQLIGSFGGCSSSTVQNQNSDSNSNIDELALQKLQRKLGCDILVTGYTHQSYAFERDGKLYLNPGSVTGASQHYAGDCTSMVDRGDGKGPQPPITPSFMLLAIEDTTCMVFTYKEINGKEEVSQMEHVKRD